MESRGPRCRCHYLLPRPAAVSQAQRQRLQGGNLGPNPYLQDNKTQVSGQVLIINKRSSSRSVTIDDAMKQIEKMEESLSRSRPSPSFAIKMNNSASNRYNGRARDHGMEDDNQGASMGASAEQIHVTTSPKMNRTTSLSVKAPVRMPDSIPEGSRDDKSGMLRTERNPTSRMAKGQTINGGQSESISFSASTKTSDDARPLQKVEPEKRKVQDEKLRAPSCMSCVIS